tara:strand:- start:619 stop:807 length:189 start_codon:yes stop_codon:yes gene_type:complete
MNNDLEYYRKPKGWVEFWIGLVVLIFSAIFFGNIAYQEHQVKMMDKKANQDLKNTNSEGLDK